MAGNAIGHGLLQTVDCVDRPTTCSSSLLCNMSNFCFCWSKLVDGERAQEEVEPMSLRLTAQCTTCRIICWLNNWLLNLINCFQSRTAAPSPAPSSTIDIIATIATLMLLPLLCRWSLLLTCINYQQRGDMKYEMIPAEPQNLSEFNWI